MPIFRKKILYVINTLHPGGAEMGVELLIDNGLFDDAQLYIVCLAESNSALEERISRKIFGKIFFLDKKSLSNKKILHYAWILKKIIKNVKPDIIICSLSQAVLVTRLTKLFIKTKNITFEHNTVYRNKNVWYLLKYTDFLTDLFWCDSTATQKSLLQRCQDARNLMVPLFFTKGIFTPQKKYITNEKLHLLAVGRLTSQKNYPQLFDVIRKIKENNIDIHLDIYGDGELKSELQYLSKELNLQQNIVFKGFIKDWIQFANKYDMYILMSDFEGLSIATLEAMSVGLPCIVKPVGELDNYIIDGITGVKINTSAEAAREIIRIYKDINISEELGNNARNYIESNHSKKNFILKLAAARKSLGL
jgi:glycosyltransferase involved in cell wall biosynthesis